MISVVIPNYNGAELLKRNLPKLFLLLKNSTLKYEVIIVDDASSDRPVEILKSFESENSLEILAKPVNEGFPVTADRGIREAKGEIVFVIKNDAVPEMADYFQLMLEHFKDKNVFAVSAGLKTMENGKAEIRGSGLIYFEKGLFKHGRGSNESEISAWADGSSSAFRRDLYLKVGGFDPLYSPGYWEDVDLGYRAWKAGYRIEFEPRAVLLHDHEQSVFKKKYGPEKLHFINLRNQFIFTLVNGDTGNLARFFLWETYNHLASVKAGEKDFIRAYWAAMWRLPAIISGRKLRAKLTKKSDWQVLRDFR